MQWQGFVPGESPWAWFIPPRSYFDRLSTSGPPASLGVYVKVRGRGWIPDQGRE